MSLVIQTFEASWKQSAENVNLNFLQDSPYLEQIPHAPLPTRRFGCLDGIVFRIRRDHPGCRVR